MTRQALDAPLAFYVAKGHGRSYGQDSSCFGKKISGIFSCGIWRALQQEKSMPISAFITDIGNDLAYEASVETILGWVEGCLDRLLVLNANAVISDLPLDVLRTLSAARYRCFRAILFPHCQLQWTEMLRRAEQLNERLNELAESRQVPVFTVQKHWYGMDPIHPRMRSYPAMWSALLAKRVELPNDWTPSRCSIGLRWYLRRLRPEKWSTFSFSRRATQPNGRLSDGTTISLY